MLSWDFGLWAAAKNGSPLHLILPAKSGESFDDLIGSICSNFEITRQKPDVQLLNSERASARSKDVWLERDDIACRLADRIFPISIRPGGKLEALLRDPEISAKICRDFQVDYESLPYGLPKWASLSYDCRDLRTLGRDFVFHLTRASAGPWPNENAAGFSRAIAQTFEGYPRDGYRTIEAIVDTRRILGSTHRIRNNLPAVCFSELEPEQLLRLVKWRARYARYSFEPYAIGIRKQAACSVGVQPVEYDEGGKRVPASIYHQGRGKDGHWMTEREWRLSGDLDLSKISPQDLVVVTATHDEKRQLAAKTTWQIASFGFDLESGT
jgi:hypothetical protein